MRPIADSSTAPAETTALAAGRERGLGNLDVVDADILVPGNVVRHVAGHSRRRGQGAAVEAIVRDPPWTEMAWHDDAPDLPSEIEGVIGQIDLVVEPPGAAR